MRPSVDIIVPVHDEEDTVDELCDRLARLGLLEAALFVDNASTDGTAARLERRGVRLLRHTRNEGYGASLRHGIAATRGELIVIIDADLEYPPETIPALLEALRTHPVVYASRFRGARPPEMPALRRLGNRLVSRLFNVLYGQQTTDLYTGMKGLRRSALALDSLRRDGFEHGVELAALITLAGERIVELPVAYRPRTRGRSKMRHIPETVKLLGWLVAYWWRCVVRRRPLGDART